MATITILLLLFGTNPIPFENQVIAVNGYIELNHYWVESSEKNANARNLDGKPVGHGYCNYDQIIIRRYDKQNDYFPIVHSSVVRDGRIKDRLSGKALKEHSKFLFKEWETAHRQAAKSLDASIEDVIVYMDSPFIGGLGINRVEFNNATGNYEVYMKAYMGRYLDEPLDESNADRDENVYKFTAKHYYETNTLYPPEIDDIGKREVGVLDISFLGNRHLLQEMMLRKKGIIKRIDPIIPFDPSSYDGE